MSRSKPTATTDNSQSCLCLEVISASESNSIIYRCGACGSATGVASLFRHSRSCDKGDAAAVGRSGRPELSVNIACLKRAALVVRRCCLPNVILNRGQTEIVRLAFLGFQLRLRLGSEDTWVATVSSHICGGFPCRCGHVALAHSDPGLLAGL
jgi:hypothetical protein